MNKSVAILYIHSSADNYGSDNALLQLIRGLDKTLFEPIVVVPYLGPLVTKLRDEGVSVYIYPLIVLHRTMNIVYWIKIVFGFLFCFIYLWRLILRKEVRVIHSNTSHVFDGALLGKILNIPHVWHIREINLWQSKIGKGLSHFVANYATHIVFISNAVKNVFFTTLGRENDSHSIVYDGINQCQFELQKTNFSLRRSLRLSSTVPLIGIVGRITYWKGQSVFVQAAKYVRDSVPSAHFLIVGDAVTSKDVQLKKNLKKEVEILGMSNYVHFLGFRTDIPVIMNELDVFVLASEKPEPWGLVILEAMAATTPVVATEQGGVLEIIKDHRTGIFVPPSDPEALFKAILYLLKNPEVASKIGVAGKKWCRLNFSEYNASIKIMNIYQELLKISSI